MNSAIPALLQKLLPIDLPLAAWLVVTAAAISVFTFLRPEGADDSHAPWQRRLIAGLAKALAFAGLALLAGVLLNHSYNSFNRVYASFTSGGSLSNQAWEAWHTLYGEPLVQHEPRVTHHVDETRVQAFSPEGSDKPPLFVDETVSGILEQNSITAFNGRVTLNLVAPQNTQNAYNAFALTALYEYEITNRSDQITRAKFSFPLDGERRLYRDVHLRVNGKESDRWNIDYDYLTLEQPMQPGQTDRVEIQYTTWGMNSYAYKLDDPREVTNFQLALAFETDDH